MMLHCSAHAAAPQVGTAKVVATLIAHRGSNIRGLSYSASANALATCSYDKTVRVFRVE